MPKEEAIFDPFIYSKVFKTPEASFLRPHKNLDKALPSCLYVFDTNSLFVPYGVSTKSLADIKVIYDRLIRENRLFIPKQCAREFLKNRPNKIKEVHEQINNALSNLPSPAKEIPCLNLEGLPQYTKCLEEAAKIRASVKGYKTALEELRTAVRAWNFNDPISALYSSLFNPAVFIDHPLNEQDLTADKDRRFLHSLPPGYKDRSKEDGGIGDVAIWHSILSLGKLSHKDVIFVSNDEKADWVIRAADQSICARYELVEEFHQNCKSEFFIISFSRFLDAQGADASTVAQSKDSAMVSAISNNLIQDANPIQHIGDLTDLLTTFEFAMQDYMDTLENSTPDSPNYLLSNDFFESSKRLSDKIKIEADNDRYKPTFIGQLRKLYLNTRDIIHQNEVIKTSLLENTGDLFDELDTQLILFRKTRHLVRIIKGLIAGHDSPRTTWR